MIKHVFKDILERDMDMLFLEEFSVSRDFCKLFMSKINIDNFKLVSTWHSKTDMEYGESDMTIVFDCSGKKTALLIENKISAIAMPEQPSRYVYRGEKSLQNKEFDNFYVFLTAPEKYLETNEKAKEYPYHVSYEEILTYFENLNDNRSVFKISQIKFAIEKQKRGYQAIKNDAVTDFWNNYICYQKTIYPDLQLVSGSDIKPLKSMWPYYKTSIPQTCIIHKSNQGNVDLTFNGQAQNIDTVKSFLIKTIGNFYEQGISVVITGKSCSARIKTPVLDFTQSFDSQIHDVKLCFEAINKLDELSKKLDYSGIGFILKTI